MPQPTLQAWRYAFVLCAAAVMVLALIPIGTHLPGTGWDKADHVLAFVVLGVLGLRSFAGRAVVCLAGLLAYGGLIELLQALVPYRFAEWRDIAADALGLALAYGAWRLNEQRSRLWPAR